LLSAAALLAACYAAFVFLSRVAVYDNIPFDDRMLSPAILLVEIAVAAALGVRWRAWKRPVRLAAAVAVALWLAASAWATARAVADARDGGWGYAGDEWRESGLGQWLRREGRNDEIFSNDPAGIWFLTHRPSRDLPAALDSASLKEFARILNGRRDLVVGFAQEYEPTAVPDSLAGRLGLKVAAEFPEGRVWRK
jgi:hypothetical protein